MVRFTYDMSFILIISIKAITFEYSYLLVKFVNDDNDYDEFAPNINYKMECILIYNFLTKYFSGSFQILPLKNST